ncbi:MAG: hypothetical protein ACRD1K_10135 [Acidimicrobiales bacterium]
MSADQTARRIELVVRAPVRRHPVSDLLAGARKRRDQLRLVDALLGRAGRPLGVPLLTTDAALGLATEAEVITRCAC